MELLSGMQPSVKPSGMILGTSLSECIAMSISLSKSSCWISLTNSPTAHFR